MNRIEKKLKDLQNNNKKAFITYMTAGLPDMKKSGEIIKAQSEAGVDIIELGIPFSDPIADGPVIQDASYRSIQKGTNLKKIFELVKEVREECEIPIIFMLYYNTVLYYGVENFVKKCIECSVDGIIIPDLPFEETFEIIEFLNKDEDAPFLIPLVSPVSKDRIPMLVEDQKGFVYCVSSMGVTGQNGEFHKDVKNYLNVVKNLSKIPVMMGFGIKNPEDIEPYKDVIDGCIVGSHFIEIMNKSNYDINEIKDYISTFKLKLNK
ncbi:tryptophan synthase subunit alpha [Clostridium butyricum]|uniref:Tryptophan synthase alpha chain n=1 Tax=Clostridium butyricum TaxID=1492 RepID=A0AAP9RJE8_CLOBU|nr:tryptophan synthase subunit alpha [Clostridium butyricum]ALR90570.1 tryptophan synthase subunit alpha [Clostridium butyricum]ALS18809.1 tryptophan synthase subunit alpha [Clostridium butyricum]ANF15992.1 tryptophan synthase subunit alpha [Clostridium butyricum]AOR95904.1 tryptophan synthase subunit alpha [Clostridium butyricum]MBZ5747253.1 tryptophan synthase subunit alpha [Clostridium butyricum]